MRSRKCVRINNLKPSGIDINGKPVPWWPHAFWVEQLTPEMKMNARKGFIYIQDAASLVPVLALNPTANDNILDMCAAPGGKTVFMAELMGNEGQITANDSNSVRLKRLKANIARCNVRNTKVICTRLVQGSFDKILIDAPCSGLGIVNKRAKAEKILTDNRLKKLEVIQKELMSHALEILRENGEIVYSTCTTRAEENEQIVAYAESLGAHIEPISIAGIGNKKLISLSPEDYGTNAFFVARLAI